MNDEDNVPDVVYAAIARELVKDGYGDSAIYAVMSAVKDSWPKKMTPEQISEVAKVKHYT